MERIVINTDTMETIYQQARRMGDSAESSSQTLYNTLDDVRQVAPHLPATIHTLRTAASKMNDLGTYANELYVAIHTAAENWILCENRLAKTPSLTGTAMEWTGRTPGTYEEYQQMLLERYRNATDESTRKLYEKYMKSVKFGSKDEKGTAYYQPLLNRIFLNWKEDAASEKGPGSTYYHEVGHMVDDYTKFFGDSSSSKEFTKSLQTDFNNYINKTMTEQGLTREEAYAYISNELWVDADNKAGLSDLMGGLSGNQCRGGWGHSNDYWKLGTEHGVPGKLNNEAFASFFEAGMSTDSTKLDYLREVFPTAYQEYQKIVQKHIA